MMKHVGEEVNIEHFFAMLAWNMFSRYSLNASFPNAGKQ
jgi:TRAP-type C4-dicarboxylate transport system permease small subunit